VWRRPAFGADRRGCGDVAGMETRGPLIFAEMVMMTGPGGAHRRSGRLAPPRPATPPPRRRPVGSPVVSRRCMATSQQPARLISNNFPECVLYPLICINRTSARWPTPKNQRKSSGHPPATGRGAGRAVAPTDGPGGVRVANIPRYSEIGRWALRRSGRGEKSPDWQNGGTFLGGMQLLSA
jgi:hypothetical protein